MLTPKELERYSRQMQLPKFGKEGQEALKNTTILISGVGGLGGTVALYLAVAGIGKLILVRGGELRLDDMNRQILMTDDWVGKSRIIKAKETLTQINPDVEIEAVAEYITAENADDLLKKGDLAISCAHNFPERDLLNLACVKQKKPLIESAMNSMDAYLTAIVPHETPCLSCIFPEKPDWDRRAFGVIGAVSGTLACLTALEAIKLITGFAKPLKGYLLNMDLANLEFKKLRLYKDSNCPVCGKK
ncbi:HesA/MoeB/ThiF family protein [Cyanobacterium sp. Dongsha4]|uniref:HesA/MoeB/ThiF family protein n=1 Tax=Cyanobacterium sp. DS4 TaxID=2878255 RepID=UPI002E807AF4|nr:HesA/MoeB/ThiF family protein [Cyanobacterium sp. Dongsha4]WVL00195.1 HesA/MoeB/ThiF family protein [Cyanobacterium sp. Dongsha4]